MIIVYQSGKEIEATSWEHARALFLDAVQNDNEVSVWDQDPESRSGYELWKFDGAARQAMMRREIPAS